MELFGRAVSVRQKNDEAEKIEQERLKEYEEYLDGINEITVRNLLDCFDDDAKEILSVLSSKISLEDITNSDEIMQKVMREPKITNLCLANERIRNAIINSEVALNYTQRLNQVLSEDNITAITKNQYEVLNGDKVYSNETEPYGVRYSYKAFDGNYIDTSISWPYNWDIGASSKIGRTPQDFSVTYEFREAVFAYNFKYQVSHGSSTSGTRKFIVQASNDGTTWIDITNPTQHTGKRWVDTVTVKPNYTSQTAKKYKMFKINTIEATGDVDTSNVGEFEILGIK